MCVGYSAGGTNGHKPYYADIISFFVVLFPAVDVVSAYPLFAHSLGNTIMSFAFNRLPIADGSTIVSSGNDDYDADDNDDDGGVQEVEGLTVPPSWIHVLCFRLLAAVPPIAAAIVVQDLGVIIDYTGLAAFAIAFLFPALLAKYSEIRCIAQGLDSHTIHSGFFTAAAIRTIVMVMASALISTVGFLLVYFQLHPSPS